ncbi:hypothetical protein PHLGIDRAFT_115011 [Phlebiopsis gigantea 11061_1 CR5-6]|uniref:Tr-type G domain-containing protein n=1 Tax=Phlebiopsis gigantea (strain 11061_1 CR5-6) TaxID=745531 RepID=A0A0C3PTK5_PHLG1|nr:hypothetical protein PHLGIDRAFT_115011 [Phlebiopsis gigantea 11061_1 CR5-6]
MTSLRSFQNEIDQIQHREVTKQRVHAKAEQERVTRDAKKVPVKSPTKEAAGEPQAATKGEKEKVRDAQKAPLKPAAKSTAGDTDSGAATEEVSQAQEYDETIDQDMIQELLLANQLDQARDILASALTQRRGELVFRIGSRPPHERLFANEPVSETDQLQGTSRSAEEVDVICARVSQAAEEFGGKTSTLYKTQSDPPHAALLLRLPPPSVALTPEILGFGPTGEPILPTSSHTNDPEAIRHDKMSWEAISIQAAKIVSFIDLAGHERYLKTTLYGLTSGAPSCVILIVGANAGLIGMSKEHLAIALALSVPVVVCITKIDMTPPNKLAETVKQVTKILKSPGCRQVAKTPVFVKSLEMAVEVSEVFAKERLCPIFQLSNVTGEGLDYLRTFLNLLPSSEGDTEKFMVDHPLEYCITEVWSVPYVGTVVDGIVNAGRLKAGDAIVFGPDANGKFENTVIKSIQRKRAAVASAEAGQCVSLALKRVRRAAIRKGMVIVHKTEAPPPRAVSRFEGQVLILYHNTTLQKNYQAMLHCGAIRQTVRIVEMDHPQGILRTGDRATVTFEFISHPEFLKEGMKLLFREGKTKGLGVVTKLL